MNYLKMLLKLQDIIKEIEIEETAQKVHHGEIEICEDEIEEDDDVEFDVDDVIVQPVDGIMIKKEEEEVRLLFFYFKPGMPDAENYLTRYKAVAEFRIPNSTFIKIAEDIEETALCFKEQQKKIDDYLIEEKIPMFA